jgi:ATP-dependent Clp protease ATP-binding subunit ClpA
MILSPSLRGHIERATKIAARSRHEYVLPEHLILSVLTHETDSDVISSILACKSTLAQATDTLSSYLTHRVRMLTIDPADPSSMHIAKASQSFTKLLESAMAKAATHRRDPVTVDLWVGFLESFCDGAQLLSKLNITTFHVKRFLEQGISPPLLPESEYPEAAVLSPYGTCLTQLARTQKLEPVVGRDALIQDLCLDLQRRRKANLLLVGEPGVGKTAVVEGLAQFLNSNKASGPLRMAHIWAIHLPDFVGNTSLRGEFEERVKNLLEVVKKHPNVILFIDEIHQLIGLGKGQGASDAANMLKPALARNELRLIGATTHAEAQRVFEKDKALQRRFVRRDVEEPTAEMAVEMIRSSLPALSEHHHVSFSPDVPETAVALAAKHIRNARLPDSALDVLDYFGSRHRNLKTPLTVSQLVAATAKFLSLPLQTLQPDSPTRLRGLLNDAVFGQSNAVESIYKHVVRAQAGLQDPKRPLGSFLFAGPTGVGKTEMANQLAKGLNLPLVRIDLSEYSEPHSVGRLTGAPPSYVGYEDGGQLSKAMHQHPSCVLLLDEVEKAHPNVIQLFLQAMDHGTITDSQGEPIDFRNSFLIFTTNLGADTLSRPSIGFSTSSAVASFDPTHAIKAHFSPEFRNRLSSVISFHPLSSDVQVLVVEKMLKQIQERLTQATLSWSDDFCLGVSKSSFDPLLGARPVERWLEEHVSTPVAELWLAHSPSTASSSKLALFLTFDSVHKRVHVAVKKTTHKPNKKERERVTVGVEAKSIRHTD